jgi:siderophore synthetase component
VDPVTQSDGGGVTTRGLLRAAGPTGADADQVERALALAAPDLVDGFRACLPAAADVVSRRLAGAAYRERLGETGPDTTTWTDSTAFLPLRDGGFLVSGARSHGFDRIELDDPQPGDPAQLLERLAGADPAVSAVGAELSNACVNLAIAYARRDHAATPVDPSARDSLDLVAGLDADEQCLWFERLATEGHNLHPCGRTRLGWSVPDILAYDLESTGTEVAFVEVHRDLYVGRDEGRDEYVTTMVHPWQLGILRQRHPDLFADGALRELDDAVPAAPTASLRTLLLPAGLSTDDTRYVKLSLDILVTSTRRSISIASTQNGPVISRRLNELLADDGVLLLSELAGSAARLPGSDRDLSAITRRGLSGRLAPNEIPIPGSALTARSPIGQHSIVDELLDRYAAGRGSSPAQATADFLEAYARLLLPPLLRLAARQGIGLEAHLQNCVITFVDGTPHRLALRDFAGLRVYPPRLSHPLALWPSSTIVTNDLDTMRSKVGYTAIQAHLGEIVVHFVRTYGLDEVTAWGVVRGVVDEIYAELPDRSDHTFLTAPTVPHKALLTMRLRAAAGRPGDAYVPVANPLR